MKSTEDIISQFDDVPHLPVDEETIGAYLEGRLPDSESIMIDDLISSDSALADLVADIAYTDPYEIVLDDWTAPAGLEVAAVADFDDTDLAVAAEPVEADWDVTPDGSDWSDESDGSDWSDESDLSDLSDLSDMSDPSSDFS